MLIKRKFNTSEKRDIFEVETKEQKLGEAKFKNFKFNTEAILREIQELFEVNPLTNEQEISETFYDIELFLNLNFKALKNYNISHINVSMLKKDTSENRQITLSQAVRDKMQLTNNPIRNLNGYLRNKNQMIFLEALNRNNIKSNENSFLTTIPLNNTIFPFTSSTVSDNNPYFVAKSFLSIEGNKTTKDNKAPMIPKFSKDEKEVRDTESFDHKEDFKNKYKLNVSDSTMLFMKNISKEIKSINVINSISDDLSFSNSDESNDTLMMSKSLQLSIENSISSIAQINIENYKTKSLPSDLGMISKRVLIPKSVFDLYSSSGEVLLNFDVITNDNRTHSSFIKKINMKKLIFDYNFPDKDFEIGCTRVITENHQNSICLKIYTGENKNRFFNVYMRSYNKESKEKIFSRFVKIKENFLVNHERSLLMSCHNNLSYEIRVVPYYDNIEINFFKSTFLPQSITNQKFNLACGFGCFLEDNSIRINIVNVPESVVAVNVFRRLENFGKFKVIKTIVKDFSKYKEDCSDEDVSFFLKDADYFRLHPDSNGKDLNINFFDNNVSDYHTYEYKLMLVFKTGEEILSSTSFCETFVRRSGKIQLLLSKPSGLSINSPNVLSGGETQTSAGDNQITALQSVSISANPNINSETLLSKESFVGGSLFNITAIENNKDIVGEIFKGLNRNFYEMLKTQIDSIKESLSRIIYVTVEIIDPSVCASSTLGLFKLDENNQILGLDLTREIFKFANSISNSLENSSQQFLKITPFFSSESLQIKSFFNNIDHIISEKLNSFDSSFALDMSLSLKNTLDEANVVSKESGEFTKELFFSKSLISKTSNFDTKNFVDKEFLTRTGDVHYFPIIKRQSAYLKNGSIKILNASASQFFDKSFFNRKNKKENRNILVSFETTNEKNVDFFVVSFFNNGASRIAGLVHATGGVNIENNLKKYSFYSRLSRSLGEYNFFITPVFMDGQVGTSKAVVSFLIDENNLKTIS